MKKNTLYIALGLILLSPLLISLPPENLRDVEKRIKAMPLPEGTVYYDVPYDKSLLANRTLDIYSPLAGDLPTGKNSPVLIYIHGGSWLHGDKNMIRLTDRFLRDLRLRGFTLISINYTGLPYGGLRVPLDNCLKALSWIGSHGAEYGYDEKSMGLYGVSAGAHLALLTAAESHQAPGEIPPLRFLLAECGPTDLRAMKEGDAFKASPVFSLFTSSALEFYSPAMRADQLTLPIMIVHGTEDETVALNQAKIMRDRLTEAGNPPLYWEIEGGNHGFFNCEEYWPVMEERVRLFMEEALGGDI